MNVVDTVVIRASSKYVGLFLQHSRHSISWTLTNGDEIWETNLHDMKSIKEYFKLNEQSCDDFIQTTREYLINNEIDVKSCESYVTFELSSKPEACTVKLERIPETDVISFMFKIANISRKLQQEVIELKRQAAVQPRAPIYDVVDPSDKRAGQGNAKVKTQPGMSLLNPASKKSKMASGVVYD